MHEVVGVEARRLQQALGQRQGHRRVVGPLTAGEPERTAADDIGQRRETVARPELDRRAERIPDRQPEQTTDGSVLDGVGMARRCGRSGRGSPADVRLLGGGLDRTRPDGADGRDRMLGRHPVLDGQTGGDRAGPAEPALAVDQDAEPLCEHVVDAPGRCRPAGLEQCIGSLGVDDRQVQPPHVPPADLRPQMRHAEPAQLLGLGESDDQGGPPIPGTVEVQAEIALPTAGRRVGIDLARAERDADQPSRPRQVQFGDLQRVVLRGPADRLHLPLPRAPARYASKVDFYAHADTAIAAIAR